MAQRTDIKESAAPEASVKSSGPEDRTGSTECSKQSEAGASSFRTIEILKEWPMIKSTVNKTQDFYESLRGKSKIINWSCSLAEKTVGVICDRCSTLLSVMRPAVRIADLAASCMVEGLQEKLLVGRSPDQVSAMRSGLSNLDDPLAETIEGPVTNGKKWTRQAAKTVNRIFRKLVLYLDKWEKGEEEYLHNSKLKERTVRQVQQQQQEEMPQQLPPQFYHECSGWLPAPAPCQTSVRPGLPSRSASSRPCVCCPDCLGVLLGTTPPPPSSSSSTQSSKSTSPVRRPALQSSASAVAVKAAEKALQLQQRSMETIPEYQASEGAEEVSDKIL